MIKFIRACKNFWNDSLQFGNYLWLEIKQLDAYNYAEIFVHNCICWCLAKPFKKVKTPYREIALFSIFALGYIYHKEYLKILSFPGDLFREKFVKFKRNDPYFNIKLQLQYWFACVYKKLFKSNNLDYIFASHVFYSKNNRELKQIVSHPAMQLIEYEDALHYMGDILASRDLNYGLFCIENNMSEVNFLHLLQSCIYYLVKFSSNQKKLKTILKKYETKLTKFVQLDGVILFVALHYKKFNTLNYIYSKIGSKLNFNFSVPDGNYFRYTYTPVKSNYTPYSYALILNRFKTCRRFMLHGANPELNEKDNILLSYPNKIPRLEKVVANDQKLILLYCLRFRNLDLFFSI
jgi:hypothetical protein